jgi:hypothetical protein
MDEIRNNMENMLDAETMMHLTGYMEWPYTVTGANELVAEEDEWSMYCRETLLYAFDYAVTKWDFDEMALHILIDAWLHTEEEE